LQNDIGDICFKNHGKLRMKAYSKQQLALRNGQEMDVIWCAYKGIIYDLSVSKRWMEGKHYEHWAGQDLTEELKDAPHEEWVFQKFNKIGVLSKDHA